MENEKQTPVTSPGYEAGYNDCRRNMANTLNAQEKYIKDLESACARMQKGQERSHQNYMPVNCIRVNGHQVYTASYVAEQDRAQSRRLDRVKKIAVTGCATGIISVLLMLFKVVSALL